jgi:hypothetical protein
MSPNPLKFLAFSPARQLLLGVPRFTFRATPDGRELLQPQTRGEARIAFEGAFSTHCGA